MSSSGQRGLLFVVSSPSGAGKTTLCRRLINDFPGLAFSVSYTTRPQRANEADGVDYRFVDDQAFDTMVAQDRFAEWAEVHGNRYGTARETILMAIENGRDVLFDVDWKGAQSLKRIYPDDTVMAFVLPPSMETLTERLRGRGTDSDAVVKRRLARAAEELRHYTEYDYLIVNEDLQLAYGELRSVYQAQHCTQRWRAAHALRLVEEAMPRS